ncbi:energy transducer TonB [Roseateles terrae]|uniref:Protein TonB n=1 Tax=Roseateles terrae TaxID=431060 RepID=A0ABR6GVL9_9BURK|nr:TonB family protein [Roseateles terrae]MBB3195269.1 protein TonB [Roseateles terrae]OWQ87275.1 energy transducer TonB [Roseateles terrae]
MPKLSYLQTALIASIGFHAALLFAVKTIPPEQLDRLFQDTPLEVILVNARGHEAPTKAQALAQANLAGGGDTDAKVRATSPLPPSPKIETGDSIEVQHSQIQELQQTQEQLLTQIRRELALLPAPETQRDKGSQQAQQQEERRRQLVQLLAEIEKRVNDENSRPKKRYLSPATQEVVYAQYYDTLRRRIEARGTRDFPTYQGKKLYGQLIMNIHVDWRGRVVETDIVQSSGNRVLDRRAVAIVEASGPFGSFTPAMKKGAEVLVITSRFRFTREEGLEATMTGNPS